LFDFDDITNDKFGNFKSLSEAFSSSEYSALFNVSSGYEFLELFFFAVIVLSLNTNDNSDSTINGDTV